MATKTDALGDVFELLDKLSGVDAAAVANATTADMANKIHAIEPASELINPMIGDFVDGITLSTPTGNVSFEALFDAYADREPIMLFGPTGAGKTTVAQALVDKFNAGLYAHNRKALAENTKRIKAGVTEVDKLVPYRNDLHKFIKSQGHDSYTSEELIGGPGFKFDDNGNRHVVERLGQGIEAAVYGHTLLSDEWEASPSGVLARAHGLFDMKIRRMEFFIDGLGNRTYVKHPEFRYMFTGNTRGLGEDDIQYNHAQPQSRAFIDRMGYMVEVGYMTPDAENSLISKREPGIPRSVLKKMIEACNNVRKQYVAGTIDLPVSTRSIEAWCREIKRAVKRSVKGTWTDSEYWSQFVVPAAGSTVLMKAGNSDAQKAAARELAWR